MIWNENDDNNIRRWVITNNIIFIQLDHTDCHPLLKDSTTQCLEQKISKIVSDIIVTYTQHEIRIYKNDYKKDVHKFIVSKKLKKIDDNSYEMEWEFF